MTLTSNEQIHRMFFVQTSKPPPRMHQKLTEHEKLYKQNNQLSTKSRTLITGYVHNFVEFRASKPVVSIFLILRKSAVYLLP